MRLCVNTLLGLGVQALAEAVTLGKRARLPRDRSLQALGETYALSPSQRSKLENARKGEYPAAFPLRLMLKDFVLILQQAMAVSVPMLITAVAAQVCAAEHARQGAAHDDEDFSAVIRTMQQMAGAGSCPVR